jgi:hypothetical protein
MPRVRLPTRGMQPRRRQDHYECEGSKREGGLGRCTIDSPRDEAPASDDFRGCGVQVLSDQLISRCPFWSVRRRRRGRAQRRRRDLRLWFSRR